ncbi:MAG: hypothetical protein Q8M07_02615 [Prosthecobacter sp.]|nr:hypothetical protein [Prosthecobacter sp.]
MNGHEYQRALAQQLPQQASRITLQADSCAMLHIDDAAVAREIIAATRRIIGAHLVRQINDSANRLTLAQAPATTTNTSTDGGQFWPQRSK